MCAKPLTDLVAPFEEMLSLSVPDSIDSRHIFITHITQDSRSVTPGCIFAAIQGTHHNGEDYIADAVTQGASAILCRPELAASLSLPCPVIATDNPRQAVSILAAQLYTPQPPYTIAVTGTDGKTSVAEFTRQFWELLDIRAASIGTLGLKTRHIIPELPTLSDNTTPEPATLHHALSVACAHGVLHVACEASSHGLDQHRLDGMAPQAAIFTSFTQDHLDYHHDMDSYFAAKARLFHELLADDGLAVLCSDYADIARLADTLRQQGKQVITYGTSGDAVMSSITPIPSGQHLQLQYDDQHYHIHLPVFGTFQAYNIVAAMLAVSYVTRVHVAELIALCEKLHTIPGRLELTGTTRNGALIFVDYAHTPGALEKALQTLQPYVRNQLHVVFGCGGDRDTGKRPQMGSVAAKATPYIILTDDNPRTEDPDTIRADIATGCPDAQQISNRREAIRTAIDRLQAGDVLLIAGKGHETYQIIGSTRHHFSDAQTVQDVLGEEILHGSE